MRQHRTPAALVLGALAVLASAVLTTPTDATQAKWLDQEPVAVPAMTLGQIGLDVAPAGDAATLTNTSDFGVAYRPVQATLLDPSGGPLTTPSGMRFEYRTGADCTTEGLPARWTASSEGPGPVVIESAGAPAAPLQRNGSAGICLAVSTDAVAEESLRPLDGRELQVVTTLEAVPAGGGTWTARHDWRASYVVDAPPVTTPAGQTTPGQCRAGSLDKTVLLSWTWTGTPTIDHWEILVRPEGGTVEPAPVRKLPGSAALGVELGVQDFAKSEKKTERFEVIVRAFPAGAAEPVDSLPVRGFKVPGNSGQVVCETVS